MSRGNGEFSPPSLAQYFNAPDDYVGHFGWLCGYSADAAFLNDAAERFTCLTSAQRQSQGRISLAVFLDPTNPHISLTDAPSVAHLPIKNFANKRFCLLHAKVALLGFKHQEYSEKWLLRLIVSTGNWTRQTLEESLDLAWRIDLSSDDLDYKNLNDNERVKNEVQQVSADIKAANNLLQGIANLFDTRLLNVSLPGEIIENNSMKQVNAWVNTCAAKAKGKPRFFDNREHSLLSQLSKIVKQFGGNTSRNYLAMGSGFYETAAADQRRPPEIPMKIIEKLKTNALLTKNAEIDIYVNPIACQSVAASVAALNEMGVTVRRAQPPTAVFGEGKGRTLHAKFLFSANRRKNSPNCNSAWIYLGSGNLTNPGFANVMSPKGGNLEAGVVFAPQGLLWKGGKKVDKNVVVTNQLPIQWDIDFKSGDGRLAPGSEMESPNDVYVAPPVAWLSWHIDEKGNELRVPESVTANFQVIDLAGTPCQKTENGFLWTGIQPRQVHVSCPTNEGPQEWIVPVIDQYGRIAATALLPIDIDDAWWQLVAFPQPPNEDLDNPDGEDENSDSDSNIVPGRKTPKPLGYPIRRMMELIENIATKQTEIHEMDWPSWCNRLQQTLSRAGNSEEVKAFIELKLNPLSPLWQAPFRPTFAENANSKMGLSYEKTLAEIEKSWEVAHLKVIGESP